MKTTPHPTKIQVLLRSFSPDLNLLFKKKEKSTLLYIVLLHDRVEGGGDSFFFAEIIATVLHEAYFAEVLQMEILGSTETISHDHKHSALCETKHLIGRMTHFPALPVILALP